MRSEAVRIDNPNVVGQLEKLSEQELDDLPFGVIRIDSAGRIFSTAKRSHGSPAIAKSRRASILFELSSCLGSDDFKGRITRAAEQGPINLDIGWSGDFASPKRDLLFRIRSSTPDDIWILVERD